MLSPLMQDIFERRLLDLRRALRENDARLLSAPPHGHYPNYLRQELESERRELQAEKSRVEGKLAAADAQVRRRFRLFKHRERPDSETERQLAILDLVEQERRPQTEAFVRKLEQEGDHRNARMHRFHMLRFREQAARENGFI